MPRNKIEDAIHSQICEFIKYQYPNVVFLSDASGLRLTPGLAKKFSKLKSDTGIPDIIILEPNTLYKGIMFEVKKDKDEYLKKDGNIRKNEHIIDQYRMLKRLQAKGYLTGFVHSLDMAMDILKIYFSNPDQEIDIMTY